MPIVKHSWLVLDVQRDPGRDEGGVPRRAHRPLRARARRRAARHPGGRARLQPTPTTSTSRAGGRRRRSIRCRSARRRARIAHAEQAGALRRRRHAQRRRLRRSSRGSPRPATLPGDHDADGQGRVPGDARAASSAGPGMHGTKWSNIAMNTCDVLVAIGARFDDRVTGKLSAFAPGATVVHLDIDPAEISKLRDADIPVVGPAARRRVGELADEVGKHRDAEGAPAPEAWLAQDRGLARRVPAPLRHERGVAQAAAGRRDAAGAHRRTTDVDRHDGRRPAPDVGDAVRPLRAAAQLHHLGRARDDGLRDSRRDRRQGGAPRGDRGLRRRRRLLPDDRPGARRRPCSTTCRSSSCSSTTATSGWSPSGRTCSSTAGARTSHLTRAGSGLRQARRGLRRRRACVVENEAELEPALEEALVARPDGRDRLPRRPRRAVLPDDPRRRSRDRHGRVRATTVEASAVKHTISVAGRGQARARSTRIATMFARRGFNIDSLAVGPTERPGVSCITLRVDCEHHSLEQIEKQIHKLVNVLRVTELAPDEAVERELLAPQGERRARNARRADRDVRGVQGRVVDLGADSVTFELTGTPEELDAFQELARPHGISGARPHRPRRHCPRVRQGRRAPRGWRQSRARRTRLAPRTSRSPIDERDEQNGDDSPRRQPRPARRQGCRHRLREPGPRPRAQPPRLRRPGRGRPARGLAVVGRGRGDRARPSARSPRPSPARSSSRSSCPTRCSRRSSPSTSSRTSRPARPCCSPTASTSSTSASRRPPATT